MSKLDVAGLELLCRRISKSALAAELGCSRPALRRWLAGTPPLSETTVREVNRTVSRLLGKAAALARAESPNQEA